MVGPSSLGAGWVGGERFGLGWVLGVVGRYANCAVFVRSPPGAGEYPSPSLPC